MAEKNQKKVGVRARKNPLKSKENAPYLLSVVPEGQIGLEEMLADVAKRTSMTMAQSRLYWNSMMEVIQRELLNGHKVETSLGLFELAVSGSTDAPEAPIDPTRNQVYVKVTPSAAIRNAAKDLIPERIDTPTSDLSISTVVSPSLGRKGYNAIRVGEPFTVCGSGLVAGVQAKLKDSNGTPHVLTVELAKGLSMICRATGQVAKGAATLTVTATAGEVVFTAARKVKVM